jgi:hypothetical protein
MYKAYKNCYGIYEDRRKGNLAGGKYERKIVAEPIT